MKFNEVLKVVDVELQAGNVPYLEGHAGIGKTELAKALVRMYQHRGVPCDLVSLFGSLLKEGELGGMPVTREEDGVLVNDYTIYQKIRLANELARKNAKDNGYVILFIDELNRSESAVLQELMQLTLDREINGNKLEDNVMIFAAGNPEENDDDVEYQVNTMNAALLDRLTILKMESDFSEWFENFASISIEETDPATGNVTYKTMIDSDIIEFLATYKDMFHITKGDSRVKATPRTWHKASEAKRVCEALGYGIDTLSASLAGKVGDNVTSTFIEFLSEKSNPFITVEEIFTGKPMTEKMIKRIKDETVPRLMVVHRNVVHYLAEQKKLKPEFSDNYVSFLNNVPKDTMFSFMKTVTNDFPKLSDKLLGNSEYLELYFAVERKISESVKN